VTHEQAGEEEALTCRDALTGALLWTHGEPGHYATTIAGEGPRATPTIAGGRVYALGSLGTLVCVDLATGTRVWRHSLHDELGAGVPGWGFSGSPLVADGRVIVSAGGSDGRSVAAFDAKTGALLWAKGDEGNSYGSPFPAVLDGVPQVVVFGGRSVAAHDAATGTLLWRQAWGVGQPLVAVPVVAGPDRLMVSAGYGVGAELFSVRRGLDGAWTNRSEWASKKLKAKFANPVRFGNLAVGLDDGILAAIDLADGRQLWKDLRLGHGQGVRCGGILLVLSESGELVALRPDAAGPHELARLKVFSGKCWNPVAMAGDRLYLRNDAEAACYRIARPASGIP
jgi:outer membrane protein assembly factor BamB